MFGGNKDHQFFIIILVSAIIISLIFHIFLRQDTEASFSEIYFPEPDKLPNEAFLGEKYNFTFLIKNSENNPSTYEYTSKLELFNLYDVTEGTYRCVAERRKKASLKWLQGNKTNAEIFLLRNISSHSNNTFFYSDIDNYGNIRWPYYTIMYRYENAVGGGSITTTFYDDNYIKYSFTIFNDASEAEFTYRNGNKINSERKLIDLSRSDHEVLINLSSDNYLEYYLDRKLLFSKRLENLTRGSLGFRMDGGYTPIWNLMAYKGSPIEVPLSKNVMEFEIDSSIITEKLERLKKESEDKVYLTRNLVNLSIKCEENQCLNLKSFLNDQQNTHSINTTYKINETSLLSLFMVGDDSEETPYPSYSLLQNTSTPELYWSNFTLGMDFQLFVKPHTFLVSFDNELMMIFHNQFAYFVVKNQNNSTIYRRNSPIETGINRMLLDSNNHNTTVYLNGVPVFDTEKEISFSSLSLHTKSTFMVFDDVVVENNGGRCRTASISKNCKRVYILPSERRVSSPREPLRVVAEPIKFSAGLGAAPFIGVSSIFDLNTNLSDTSAQPPKPTITQLINYEIDINRSLINEKIPSEKYVFDGRNALLRNQTNYSFGFNFNMLDGLRLLEVSFYNNDKVEINKFILNQPKNEIFLFANYKGSVVKTTANFNVSVYKRHGFDINYESNKTAYYLDNKKIFELEGIDMSSGYFSISTYNTHMDINDLVLFNGRTGARTQISINKDPCALRKIDQLLIGKGSLFLDNNENKTISNSFVINQDFDYGLVSASLKQEGRNESEIHFWVVRSD